MWKSALRSEWARFFSYHWCIWGMIGAILLPPVALLFSENNFGGIKLQEEDVVALCLRFLYLGQAGIVVAMAGFLGQEYTHSSLRTTLLTVPSRMRLFLTKKLVVVSSTIIAGILSSILCFIVIIAKYQYVFANDVLTKFITAVSLAIISWIVLGCISASLSIITKSLIVPIAVLFPMIIGGSQMLLAVTEVAKYLPDLAGMNLFLIPEQKTFLALGLGVTIQLMWVISLECTSAYVFHRRDIR